MKTFKVKNTFGRFLRNDLALNLEISEKGRGQLLCQMKANDPRGGQRVLQSKA